MPRKRLTEQGIERMRPPKVGRVEVHDAAAPGLILRLTDRGTRTFAVLYRVAGAGKVGANGLPLAGPMRRMTLGRWPKLKLSDARERAREVQAVAAA